MRLDQLRYVDWWPDSLWPDSEQLTAEEQAEENALRKVLATREHVMRKQEAARHRAKVARRQHGQGKSRDR